MGLKFLRPDENLCYGASVTTSAGTTDSTFTDDWLTDGRPGRPAKATGTSVTWAITVPSGVLSLVVIHNHNLTVTPTISGTISPSMGTILTGTDGITFNPWGTATEATGTSVIVAVSSNGANVTIGEVLSGKVRETSRGLQIGRFTMGYLDTFKVGRRSRSGSVPERDLGFAARWLKATLRCTATDVAMVQAWWEASRNGTRPSVIIPFPDLNDAWVVQWAEDPIFTPLKHISTSASLYDVQLSFEEEPRRRWP